MRINVCECFCSLLITHSTFFLTSKLKISISRGLNISSEYWSNAHNFRPEMDQFSMEYWPWVPFYFRETIFFIEYWSGGPFFSWQLVRETNFFMEYDMDLNSVLAPLEII